MTTLDIIAALKKSNVVPRLVGDQLRLVGETRNLRPELLDQIRSRKDELSAFLRDAMDQRAFSPIPAVLKQDDYPASNAQKRIWVLSQLEGGSAAYNIVRSFYLKGRVVKENLEKAFRLAIKRHESLRTVFREVEGELRQVICKDMPFEIDIRDVSTSNAIKEELKAEVEQAVSWKFNLEQGPLINVKLYKLGQDEYAMIFAIHHIVSDGWSIGVLVPEVMRAYREYCTGNDPIAEPLSIHYKDYCQWHEERMTGEKGKLARQFWESQFAVMPDPLELPADATRPAARSFEGAVTRFYPGQELYAGIQAFCKSNHITTFNFFRATLSILLSRISGQNDIVIGSPASGRNHLDLENQVGLYVNTLPLRAHVEATASFQDFLKQVTEHSFRVFEFQDYPFDRIIEDLQVRRDLSRNPLFDVMLAVQDAAIGEGSVNKHQQYGFELSLLNRFLYPAGMEHDEKIAAKFDLTFNLDYEPDNTFYIEIEYDSRLFRRKRISRIFHSYMHVIRQAMLCPGRPISTIEITTPEEKYKILHEFNSPIGNIEEHSIIQLLESSFEANRSKTAIIINDRMVTYGQLNEASDNIAAQFTGHKFVGLLMGRSEQTIASILGILKAGAAYVPIDITYPASRIEYIIGDAQLSVILVDEDGLAVIPPGYGGRIIHVSQLSGSRRSASGCAVSREDRREQTAYMIYTSGSTGNPKGVEICHRNTIAFLKWCGQEFAATPFDILYATTSYCFDLSVFEFLFPLMQGRSIRMLSSAMEIADWAKRDDKVMLNTVPSVVRGLLEAGMDWTNITAINVAGEPVPKNFKTDLDHQRIEIRNLYGPTEDTTYSTMYRFAADDHSFIPIGSSVGYSQLYVLDPYYNLLPAGVYGEIFLAGQSVAKGYFNRPALTAERFLENPFIPGSIMYRTGDIGRWTEDGMVEFAGRVDDQVKIRGHRIEPGEVQYRLEQHPLVKQAVVTVRKLDGEDAMVAYVKGDGSLTTAVLKEYLSGILPAYMMPAFWMLLDEIPLNSNGKVDKKRLPHPVFTHQAAAVVEPSTELQRKLVSLWKKVIATEELGVTDNFFERGGHSLKATKLRFLVAKELDKELTLNEIFCYPTVEQQANLLEDKPLVTATPIETVAEREVYPISLAQERLWVLTKFEEASVAYNMPAVYKVNGHLDVEILRHAFQLVIERYEILRTVFTEKGGIPVQRVLKSEDVDLKIEKIIRPELSTGEALQLLKEKWQMPFNLEKGPLLRCIVLGSKDALLLSFNMHHIISDGWSLGILYKNISEAYRLILESKREQLPHPSLQYKDYAVWQRIQLATEKMDEHRRYWREVFSTEVPALELPTDFNRPEVKTYRGDAYYADLSSDLSSSIQDLSVRAGASHFMMLMTAVRILLKKYTGETDIVIGTPVSGRDHPQLQDQLGFYVNTLPVRGRLNSADSFLTALQQEKQIMLAAFEHQELSFEVLVEELQLKRDLSRSPLFDVMLVLQEAGEHGSEMISELAPGIQLERMNASTGVAKYDLLFSFSRQADGFALTLEYNADLFLPATIARMANHLRRVLEQITASPEVKISDILLPDEAECALLASKADQTKFAYDANATIISLFEQAVASYPDNIAITSGSRHITYRELDTRSGQLANILMHQYGVQTEDLVVLNFRRNEWMLIAILGVLKAGAAYVPVDPDYPQARIEYILQDSASRIVLSDAPSQNHGMQVVDTTALDYTGNTATAGIHSSNLAYVIYTSGTTGNPKGVLIEHQQVARLLFHEGNLYDFNSSDRWSLFHSYCFDFSVWEMYGALLYGGTVVVVPKHISQDGRAFYEFLQKERITVLNQTPTAFRSMLQANTGRLSADLQVRYLIFGGEALMPGILAPWMKAVPHCKIINMYGITETTVHVTYKEITGNEIADNRSNIGLPMPTVSCYVLDADLKQVPVGVTGELCVGGSGVARGYLNKPELTAAKFIEHPLKPGERMYRSGDFARILSNGDIEYIGRRDDQVKIRGHRIETAEVEAAVLGQRGIKDAVVLPLKNAEGEYELAAYFIPTELFESSTRLRHELSAQLPGYMVPSYLVQLQEFPLNNNGKLDKTMLPRPQEIVKEQTVYASSRNETDKKIMAIWEAVLERKDIGIKDNFFDLGGHSLKATRVVSRIHETMGVKVDLKALFMDPTIENLSNYVETIRWMESKDEVLTEKQDEIIF